MVERKTKSKKLQAKKPKVSAQSVHFCDKCHHGNFGTFARAIACISGRPITFLSALFIIIVWATTGPVFNFNDTWQLVINTGTTIITFLMVFLIQNTQNRDSAAVQLKLDEIIRALDSAENEAIGLEEKTEEELDEVKEEYLQLADKTDRAIKARKKKES